MRKLITMFMVLFSALTISVAAHAPKPHITPEPSYVEMHSGEFIVTPDTKIVVYDEAWDAAKVFAKDILHPGAYFILEHPEEHNFESHPYFVKERKYGTK